MKKNNLFLIIILIVLFECRIFSQSENKIIVGLHGGLTGWDSSPAMEFYGLSYGFRLNKRVSIIGKYALGDKRIKMNTAVYYSVKDEFFTSSFISSDNTSKNPAVEYFQYNSFSIVAKIRTNNFKKSSLNFYIGGTYFIEDKMYFSSSGSELEFYQETYENSRSISMELGVSYDYQINNFLSLNSNFNTIWTVRQFSISMGADVYF